MKTSLHEVHLTDRKLIENKTDKETVPSSPLNIVAAGHHSLEHWGKTKRHFEVQNEQSIEGSSEVSEIGKIILSVAQLVNIKAIT